MTVDVETMRAQLLFYGELCVPTREEAEEMLDEIVALRERVAELEEHAFVPPLKNGQRVILAVDQERSRNFGQDVHFPAGSLATVNRGWLEDLKGDQLYFFYDITVDGDTESIWVQGHEIEPLDAASDGR
jgi:hypothetical protein